MTAGFYSFKVWARDEAYFPEDFLVLGVGENVFNTTVKDIAGFREKLAARGVRILEEHRLDADNEEIPPVSLDDEPHAEGPRTRLLSVGASARDDRGGSPPRWALPGSHRETS